VKKAILDLQARGFQQASQAGSQIAGSLDKAAASASAAGAAATRMGSAFGGAAGQANALKQGAMQLGSVFNRIGSASENPFMRAAGNVIGAGATGLAFGGLAGAGVSLIATLVGEIVGRLSKDDEDKSKTEINQQINVALKDGDIERAAKAAYEGVRQALLRRTADISEAQAHAARLDYDGQFQQLRR
jgi:hypothetical protein